MRDTLKEVGDKTGVGPGIDIVDRRDRFHVTMDPGASLRLSPLPTCLDSWTTTLP